MLFPEYASYFVDPFDASLVAHAQHLDGPFVEALTGLAARHDVHVVAGLLEHADDQTELVDPLDVATGLAQQQPTAVELLLHDPERVGHDAGEVGVGDDVEQLRKQPTDSSRVLALKVGRTGFAVGVSLGSLLGQHLPDRRGEGRDGSG